MQICTNGNMYTSAHLTTASAASKLPVILKAPVIVASHPAVVELCTADEGDTVLCCLPGVVYHKAEAAWSLLDLVQTHGDCTASNLHAHDRLSV